LKITVRFFALFRELAGMDSIDLQVEPGLTLGDLKSVVTQRFPRLAASFMSTAAAVNGNYSNDSIPLKPGDEVAFLPPLSGGQRC
jgi:molybdopterin converting factor subunit 1